jgi:Double zinc ribbon
MYGSMRLMRQQDDWYAFLNLPADAASEEIERAVERLSRQAAALAATAPERSQQLRDKIRAVKRDLLSGPESRARYDASRGEAPAVPAAPAPQSPPPAPGPALGVPAPGVPAPGMAPPGMPTAWPGAQEPVSSRIMRFLRTGWTCPACGKGALPADKFCTRCGGAITPTRQDGQPAQAERASCANCGATLGTNDAFCARCGARSGKLAVTLYTSSSSLAT